MNLFDDSHFESEAAFCGSLQRQRPDERCGASGIPLKYENEYIYTDISDNHTLIFGNTGSKKTRNFCVPTIFSLAGAGESMVISDPKGELYRYTSGYLAEEGYRIRVINFRQPETGNYWNPLHMPYYYYCNGMQDKAVELVMDLAEQLKSQIHSEKDLFWEQMAADLFVCLTLILFDCAEDESIVHLGSIQRIREKIRLYNEDDEDSQVFWQFADEFSEHPIIRNRLHGITALKTVEKTLNCVLASFDMLFQNLCINNAVLSMMSEMDFEYDEIFCDRTAVYMIMPDEKRTFHFLISVLIKQCYEYFIDKAQALGGRLPIRVNYVLDEFSNLSHIADMPSMISAARSRNIRFFLIVQSAQQLDSMYKNEAETIRSNCQNWVFLASREVRLLDEISKLCGNVYIEGRGYRPLLGIMALQNLKVGWEDSQTLILRNHCYPYISWVKDFSVYPQARYDAVNLKIRPEKKMNFFSIAGYMVKILEKRLGENA